MNRQEVLQKAEILKQYEDYGYQVAYFLLENESLAKQAATRALVELFNDDEFFQIPSLQKQKTKRVFIQQSLLTKASLFK